VRGDALDIEEEARRAVGHLRERRDEADHFHVLAFERARQRIRQTHLGTPRGEAHSGGGTRGKQQDAACHDARGRREPQRKQRRYREQAHARVRELGGVLQGERAGDEREDEEPHANSTPVS
jgi:hypothetical protein